MCICTSEAECKLALLVNEQESTINGTILLRAILRLLLRVPDTDDVKQKEQMMRNNAAPKYKQSQTKVKQCDYICVRYTK